MAKVIKESEIIEPKALDNIAGDLAKIAKEAQDADTAIKNMAGSLKDVKFPKMDTKSILEAKSSIEQVNVLYEGKQKIDKESIRLQQELEKLNGIRQRNETARAKEAERIAKNAQKAEAQKLKALQQEQSAYQQTQKRAIELYQTLRDLAIQGKTNGTEFRKLKKEYDKLDKSLKSVDESFGKSQRNVGNYKSALGGVAQLAGQMGIAFSGFTAIKSAGATLVDFENNVASFRKIVSDLSEKDFEKYKSEIGNVAKDTKVSSVDIAKSFENIAGLNADLAKTADGLGQVSKSAITLSKASGDDLEPTTANLVGIMNQFSLGAEDADRAINVLAAGQAVGAASIGELSEAYKNVGSVASGANISLEQSTALLETLGKFSIKGAEGGTKLRGVILQLQKANLGYQSGRFNINDALEEYNKKIAKATSEGEKNAIAQKVFGAENITAGQILAKNIPLIQQFTKEVTGTSEAQKGAEIASNTLSNRWSELKASLVNIITSSTKADGAMGVLKSSMKFLASNMQTVLSWVGRLITAFISFKLAMKGLELVDRVKDWRKYRKSLKEVEDGVKSAGEGVKGFGRALKSIGFAVALQLLIELAKTLWDIASGARQAREDMARFTKAQENAGKVADETIARLQKEKELRDNNYKRTIKNQDELNKKLKESNDIYVTSLHNASIATDKRKQSYKDALVEVQKLSQSSAKAMANRQSIAGAALGVSSPTSETEIKNMERLKEIAKQFKIGGDEGLFGDKNVSFRDVEAQLKALIGGANTKIKAYNGVLGDARETAKDLEAEIKDQGQFASDKGIGNKQQVEQIEDYTEKVNELANEALPEYEKARQELADKLIKDINSIKDNGIKAKEYEEALRKKYNTDIEKLEADHFKKLQEERENDLKQMREDNLSVLNSKIDAENQTKSISDLKTYYAEKEELLKKNFKNENDLQDALSKLSTDNQKKQLEQTIKEMEARISAIKSAYGDLLSTNDSKLSEEELKKKKEMVQQINQFEEQGLQAKLQLQDLEIDKRQKFLDKLKKAQEQISQTFSNIVTAFQQKMDEMYQKQIDNENRLIDKSKQRIDYLTQAAAMGNQQATQSILAEEKRQEQAQKEIQRIEKNKQRMQFVTSMLSLLSQKISSGDKHPVLSTIGDSAVMSAFLKSLPTFKKGTDVFSTEGAGVDGEGGKLAVLHNNERVVTASQNAMIGYGTSNEVLSNVMYRYRKGEFVSSEQKRDTGENSSSMAILQEIKKGFENITSIQYDVNDIVSSAVKITKSELRGKTKIITSKNYRT